MSKEKIDQIYHLTHGTAPRPIPAKSLVQTRKHIERQAVRRGIPVTKARPGLTPLYVGPYS